jgi:hypothetical protein
MEEGFHDGTLVDDAVQRVTHFVRDCAVDEGKELTFGFGGVVQDLLWDVSEAKHEFVVLVCVVVNSALFKLKEREFWNEIIFDAFHAF